MRKGNIYNLKVRSVFLLDILKTSKFTDLFTIFIRDVKFDENLLAYKPNSMFDPSLPCEPYSTFVPYFIPIVIYSSSGDVSEDENPPLTTHIPLYEYIEHEPTPTPQISRWVRSTREATGDLVGDPSYKKWTCSQLH
jgi:hypothetical protein